MTKLNYRQYMQKYHNIDILNDTYYNYKESYKNVFKREFLNYLESGKDFEIKEN